MLCTATFLSNSKVARRGSLQTLLLPPSEQMWAGLEPLVKSSLTPLHHPNHSTQGGLCRPQAQHTCPLPPHHPCSSPILAFPCTWPLRTNLSHLPSSLGGRHILFPKVLSRWGGKLGKEGAERPVSDAQPRQSVARLEFSQLKRRCSGDLSSPRPSHFFFYFLKKSQGLLPLPKRSQVCEEVKQAPTLTTGCPDPAPPQPAVADRQVEAPSGLPFLLVTLPP